MTIKNIQRAIPSAIATVILGIVPFAAASAAQTDIAALAKTQAVQAWHEQVKEDGPPAEGCWSVSYPSRIWTAERCNAAPNYRSIPPSPTSTGHSRITRSTSLSGSPVSAKAGAGVDYSAVTASLTRSATGSFPTVTGVTSESGALGANKYTLQLNTNTSDDVVNLGNTSPYCAANGYAACSTWQQFIYSTDNGSNNPQVFIQNWLFVGPGDSCPRGWQSFNTSEYQGCFTNSQAVAVPNVPASSLGSVKLAGSATANGNDTVTFTNGTKVYAISQRDSTLQIASTWNTSEFNVVGDGSNSPAANFNRGSSITVKLAVNDGSTRAPSCLGPNGGGTTGEYNNLTLGRCTTSGGAMPFIQFTESN